jgi:branched-subunit amino acid aminotransferase/4-amino-4-deoxychorismate lyase
MADNLFVNINGNIQSSASAVLSADNRSFRYGDGIFETIRFANGKVQFLARHVNRLRTSLEILKIDCPEGYTEAYFRTEINKLVEKNKVEKGARIRLTVFRKEGGYYTPHIDEPHFLIECEPIEESFYNLNPKGYSIDIFPDYKKPINRLSNVKSNNALLHVLAGVYRKQNDLDDCIILNQNFGIAEGISSNIFAVKNGVLYTPPIVDGCVDGIMRRHIIEVARAHRISVYEVSLQMNVLLNSDELFLTNVISGVRWVGAYKAKRFYNNMAKHIIDKLNESLE